VALLTLDQLTEYVNELPALPDSAIKVLRLTDDPATSSRGVSQAISADLGLTSRVLRIANSAYYGMSRSISTVNEAVLILGMQAIRNLALAAAAHDMMKKEFAGYGMAAGELWRHSISSAITAQIIAKRTRAVRIEEAFVAGLLHDIGKVILNIHVAPQFQAIRALAELDAMPFHDAEKFVLGFDHAEVGAKVAEKWNLPHALCAAILGHHCLERAADAPALTAIVHVSNALTCCQMLGPGTGDPAILRNRAALDMLGLNDRNLDDIREETARQLERAKPILD
jgi:putative nucleotidyltransferase with HDIG domain